MRDLIELHEFFVEGNDQNRSHVLLHITEPGTPEEQKKGYFFAVAEINNTNLEQIEHLQQMIDDLESGYYETEEEDGKDAFETTLEFINRRGHHILQYKNSLIHCLVGVVRNHEVSFAYHGSPSVTLFYEGKNDLEHVNVIENEPAIGEDCLFSSMLQGNINIGDHFYVATPHVTDYFTIDRIKKILSSRNTRQSAEHIQKVLGDLNNELSFGGAIIHFPTQIPKTGKQLKMDDTGSAESLNNMILQEKTTKEILSPPLMGNLKGTWQQFRDERQELKNKKKIAKAQQKRQQNLEVTKRGNIETNFREHEETENFTSTVLISIGRALVNLFIMLYKLLKVIVVTIAKILLMLFILATNRGGQREIVIRDFKNKIHQKKEKINNIPLSSKLLLLLIILLAIIFVANLSYFKIKEARATSLQVYNNQVEAILEKKNSADANLIYQNEEAALTTLQEAKTMIANLPNNNKTQAEKITELNNQVESVLMKLRKLSNIKTELIADLTQTNPEAKTQRLALIDNTLVAYGEEDINLYKINLDSKVVEQKSHNTVPRLLKADTPKENDKIIFITGKNLVAQYDKESSNISQSDISFPHDNTNMSDIFIYNQKAYVLDPANNQLYKHNITQTGFDKGQDWIKDNTDIKDGVSVAIDGDIFILKQNGDIFKFIAGTKADFNVTGLEPKLNNPTEIWTYNNVQNIYLLEPTGKRIIILGKDGKMLNQYTTTDWQNPTSMIVREDQKTIYVLDNNKVYKFSI